MDSRLGTMRGALAGANEGPSPLIQEKDLARFYQAVSLAQHEGRFASPHGPLEETAWIHVTEHLIEEIERSALRVASGDVAELHLVQSILATTPQGLAREVASTTAAAIRRRDFTQLHEPIAVAVVAGLLDHLDTSPVLGWGDRLIRAYADGGAAVNQALGAADAYLRGYITVDAFEAAVHASNTYGGGAHAGMSRDDPTPKAMIDASGHSAATHSEGPKISINEPKLLDGLTTPAGEVMTTILASAHEQRGRPIPDLLRTLVDPIRSVPQSLRGQKLPLELLAVAWDRLEPQLRASRSVAHKAEPIRMRDGDRGQCVEGQPQSGGRWELASVRATDTAKHCPPAEAIDQASARLYGDAGANLIKVQNEITNARECFKGVDSERCVREADHGFSKCTEERDYGYNRCDAVADRGYKKCCKWKPCSWFCRAWEWIKHLVCIVWTWLANIVCVVWTWIKKMTCVAWEYLKAIGCAVPHIAKAALKAAQAGVEILLASATRAFGGIVSRGCKFIGWGGQTTTSSTLKVVGVHLALLHTGRVLIFSYDEGVQPVSADNPADFTAIGDSERSLCAVWDPKTGLARYVDVAQNIFCSHHAFAPSGELFVAGGQFPLPGLLKSLFPSELLAPGADRDVHIFDPVAEQWHRLPDMVLGRWYPTCATLHDGKILVISGTNGYATEAGLGRHIQNTWEISDPASRSIGFPQLMYKLYHLYPFVLSLPSKQVFIHSRRTTSLFEPADGTFIRIAAGGAAADWPGSTQHPFSRTGPGPGTCVLLPLIPKVDAETSAVVYPAGRVLILGGGGAEGKGEPELPGDGALTSYTEATNTAEILDLGSKEREWVYTDPMQYGRVMPDSILLPTGKVLVVGGGQTGQSGGLLAHFTSTDVGGRPNKGATKPVHEPEMFDPETETWSTLCPKPVERLYHTTALLLPDARVLVAGHDGALNMAPYDRSHYELELFSPPYLFDDTGQSAARPEIVSAPENISYGQEFEVVTPSAATIDHVALIRQSSVTHQTNTDQRYVGLAVIEVGGGRLRLAAPSNGGVAPPGHYMLFVVDQMGVPSVAHWVRLDRQG